MLQQYHPDPDYQPSDEPKKRSTNPTAADYAALVCPGCGVEKEKFRAAYLAQWTALGYKKESLRPHSCWGRHIQGARLGRPCDPNVLGKNPAPQPAPQPAPPPQPQPQSQPELQSQPKPKTDPLLTLLGEVKKVFAGVGDDIKLAEDRMAQLRKEGDDLDREIARLKRKRQRVTETAEEYDARVKRARQAIDKVNAGMEAVRAGVDVIAAADAAESDRVAG